MSVDVSKETLGFQAEVRQLLDLMIHSLYSNKEIFLRELISNASDAIDKFRFEAISAPELYGDDTELKIRVSFDKEARTITIADNGIGMTRQEVIENIGTIAKSGTREFFQSLTGDQRKDANLIGQFGVGFYSSFIVADKVTLLTRRAGANAEEAVRWESDGAGEFTIENSPKATRGTEVTLHLREGEDELLNDYQLRSIIHKYSDHIPLPIVMTVEPKEGEEEAGPTEETVNKASALWTRSKNEISEEEYTEFYKHVAHDFTEPLAKVHSRMEGKHEYTLLLYLPAHAPFDLWSREHHHGVKLYVRRVFIMDDADKLMPSYLRFIRGVIDSNDLPLNVSREILQQHKLLEVIRAGAVKKVLGMLDTLANNDAEKYTTFWKEFGPAFKEGVAEDASNKEAIAKLIRVATTKSGSEEQTVSLEDYIGRMKEGQDKIYYITADTYAAAKNSPLLEIFKQKDLEVILFSDMVDNWVVNSLPEYQGKKLQSVAKGAADLGNVEDSAEKEEKQKIVSEFKELTERIKQSLGDKVKDVRVSNRLTTSPACLVADEYDLDNNFKRILKAAGQKVFDDKPIMEINPQHPLLEKLRDEHDEKRLADWSNILLDQSILNDGGQLEDPAAFVTRLNDLLVNLTTGK